MWIDPDKNKFLSKYHYVELMRYIPDSNRMTREKDLYDITEIEGYRRRYNNTGLFSSVWHYDSRDSDRATGLASLYFDLDSANPEEAQVDTVRLVEYLSRVISESAIRIYYSGKKGFHLECEAVALGITPAHDLAGLYRYIATELRDQLSLTTLDFAVYDQRRMWRITNSRHQESGLYKIPLSRELLAQPLEAIRTLAQEPLLEKCPAQEFEAKANEWYREWRYKQEVAHNLSVEERIARFNKHGTSAIRDANDGQLSFDPQSLFANCPALLRLWDKAEQEHHLEHEERLFLCSILTYTDEAIDYLHQILSLCSDYRYEKSKAHIDDWIRRRELGIGGRAYSCRRANSVGVGCGNCDLEPREKLERVGNKLVPTGEMADPSAVRFAYRKNRTSQLPKDRVTIDKRSLKKI